MYLDYLLQLSLDMRQARSLLCEAQQGHAPHSAPASSENLARRMSKKFGILDFRELESGMQESVEASRDWFITCEAYAAGMAAQLAAHATQLTSFEAQQPLLYLINAVLFAGYAPQAPLLGTPQHSRRQASCIMFCGPVTDQHQLSMG